MTAYSLAVIDPPWKWLNWTPGHGERPIPYTTISTAEIAALPIGDLLAPNAVVMLWVVDSMLPDAMQCLTAWGLTYKTVGIYWTKERPSGREHMGLGYYTRANPEQCWIATKGKGIPRVSKAVRRWLHAPSGAHSEKPDLFYRKMEELFGDVPRVDVFARKHRVGWHVIGDAIDGRDIRDVLKNKAMSCSHDERDLNERLWLSPACRGAQMELGL